MAMALAIHDAVTEELLHASEGSSTPFANLLTIKWPNDIYWQDRKLCGILIENKLSGNTVKESIIGVGLNINQQSFLSDAPNPVSLFQITGRQHSRSSLLSAILSAFSKRIEVIDGTADDTLQDTFNDLRYDYTSLLYRKNGFHRYRDAKGIFDAEFETIEDSGMIILRDTTNRLRRYAFKEVQHII
jgi:BirA family biotin operon repressor/biotin-[acetyl-CoA-carboxylase] ligase